MVEGEQRGNGAVQFVERRLDPGIRLLAQLSFVLARDAGVAHRDGGVVEDVDAVDRPLGHGLPEQGLAAGRADVVVARAGEYGERRLPVARPEQTSRLLVLRLRAVVRDVAGHQQGVHSPRQLPQPVPHPLEINGTSSSNH
jgi:hypothetical protein